MPKTTPRKTTKPSDNWREILRRLEGQHGRPAQPARRNPLEQLILSILSEQTSQRKALQALRRLQTDFVDFNEVRVTRPADLARSIQVVNNPEEKARRIIHILRQLFRQNAQVDLDFLTRQPLSQARGFLERLEGLDSRTVAAVVLLSLGGNALPADPDLVRVCKRLGLVERAWNTEQVQQTLENAIPADDKLAFYQLMTLHGQKVCLVKTARCARCALKGLCPSSRPDDGQAATRRTSSKTTGGKKTGRTRTRRSSQQRRKR